VSSLQGRLSVNGVFFFRNLLMAGRLSMYVFEPSNEIHEADIIVDELSVYGKVLLQAGNGRPSIRICEEILNHGRL